MGVAASLGEREARTALRAGRVAVGVGLAVLALKAYAAWRTDSLALLADAAESVVNVVAALIALAALATPARSGDGQAAYGQGRLEFLSAGIEGALVVLAAFVVAFEAIARYGREPALPALAWGLGVSVVGTAANGALARFLEGIGRRERATALLVEAVRVRRDVVTSLAVYGGFGVAWALRWWPLDALLALALSLHILVAGLRAVRHSVAGLLDESLRREELAAIEGRLAAEGPPVLACRDLRARRSGAQAFIEFRLVVSRYALVYEAHAICDRLEEDLGRLVPGARVAIQVEPEGEASRPRAVGSA